MSSQKRHTSKKVKARQKQKRIERQLKKQEQILEPEKNLEPEKKKKRSVFGIVLLSYCGVILLCGAALLYYLWGKLDTFQTNYETAMVAANPDLIIGNYLDLFNCDNISQLVLDEWDEISPYETQANIDLFIKSHVKNEDISWKRRDDFSDLKPKYDIYSDGSYVGAVALKQKSAVDDYGFHMCELDHAEIGFVPENLKSVRICAYEGTTILVNGLNLTDDFVSQSTLQNEMDKEASEETGNEYRINTYELTGFFEYPEVVIEKSGYVCDMEISEDENGNNVYSQTTMYDPMLLEELNGRVLEIAKAYDMYAAGRRGIGSMGPYFMYSGRGYRMLSGLAFDISIAGTTTVYDILEEDTGNLLSYSPEDVVIDTYQSIYRVHRNIEYNENINVRWYLKKVNGRWMVKDFSMRL